MNRPPNSAHWSSEFGRFEGAPEVALLSSTDDTPWTVRFLDRFTFIDPAGRTWTVEPGFRSDGASVPRWAWTFIGGPLDGAYRDAAFIHDAACAQAVHPWWIVHQVFYLGLRARDVSTWKAQVMFAAVYHFGPRWPWPSGTSALRERNALFTGSTLREDDFERLVPVIRNRAQVGRPMSVPELRMLNRRMVIDRSRRRLSA